MSEPLSEERLAEIAKRVETCQVCGGGGKIDPYCDRCLDSTADHACPAASQCPYCDGDGKSPDDEGAVALLAEVRRLREENDRLASLFQTTHHVHHGWVEAGMRTIRAEHERDAARADLARAIELLRRQYKRGGVWHVGDLQDYAAFLAEMEKR